MKTITSTFLRGLGVILPVALTVWLVVWLAVATERLLKPLFVFVLGESWYLPGLGLLTGLAVVYLVGMLVNIFVVQRLWEAFESLFSKIPLVKTVFTAIKDFFEFFSSSPAEENAAVVRVDVGQDSYLIGFVTDSNPRTNALDGDGIERIAVYLPLSYQIGGYTLMVPKEHVSPLDIKAEDAMRLVLTAAIQKRG